MCGHALISANLVRKGIQDMACGAKTHRRASMMIAKLCLCTIDNLDRGDQLLAWQAVAYWDEVRWPTGQTRRQRP